MKNIIDTLRSDECFATFLSLVEASGLAEKLEEPGPFTVFAPNNVAFKKIASEALGSLKNDQDILRRVVSHHIAKGDVRTGDFVYTRHLDTLSGDEIEIGVRGGLTADHANLIRTDIACTNGVVHVIDDLLVPEDTGTGVEDTDLG